MLTRDVAYVKLLCYTSYVMSKSTAEKISGPTAMEAIMANLEVEPGFENLNLIYDSFLGGLSTTDPETGLTRLLFFRAVDQTSIENNSLTNRSESQAKPANMQYGSGLYGGNCAEAVLHFNWKPGRQIYAFLTPSFEKDDVSSKLAESRAKKLGLFISTKLMTVKNNGPELLNELNSSYGKSDLVILPKPIDVKISQRIQSNPYSYPVEPVWYLWRGTDISKFERVGVIKDTPKQRELAGRVVNFAIDLSNKATK